MFLSTPGPPGESAKAEAPLASAHHNSVPGRPLGCRSIGPPRHPPHYWTALTTLGPSELLGALRQVVLACGAGDVVAHLHGGRLSDVDQGLAIEMLGPDLEGGESWLPGANSCWFDSWRWATRCEARLAISRMAPAWASAVSPPQTWAGSITGAGKGF